MEAFLADDISKYSEFVSGDFAGVIEAAGNDDVIFCDPPMNHCPTLPDLQITQGIALGLKINNGWCHCWWMPTDAERNCDNKQWCA